MRGNTEGASLSRELGRSAEALSFWRLSRSSGRSIPIGPGLRPEGVRRVRREIRWRWRLKVLWVAACMETKRWADPGDLNLCISSAEWLVGDLSPVILVNPLFMDGAQADLLERSPI